MGEEVGNKSEAKAITVMDYMEEETAGLYPRSAGGLLCENNSLSFHLSLSLSLSLYLSDCVQKT